MKSLSTLTGKIREWNSMGLSLLPSLEIAIIHSSAHDKQVVQLLQVFGHVDLLYDEKIDTMKHKNQEKIKTNEQQKPPQKNEQTEQKTKAQQKKQQSNQLQPKIQPKINSSTLPPQTSLLIKWDSKLSQSIYAIYLANQTLQARIHLIIDQQIGEKINDESLKATKKIIQRLKRNKNIIFINFNASVHKLDVMSEHIEQFGLSYKTKEREIKFDSLLGRNQDRKSMKRQKNNSNLSEGKKNMLSNLNKQQISTQQKPMNANQKHTNRIPNQNIKSSITQKVDLQFNLQVRQKLDRLFTENQVCLTQALIVQIQKKYLSLFGVDINKNFTEMKAYHKQVLVELKRYEEIMNFIEKEKILQDKQKNFEQILEKVEQFHLHNQQKQQKNLTSYGLNCLHRAKQYLVSSLWGTYSRVQIYRYSFKISKSSTKSRSFTSRRSLHWQIMQIMNEIWDIEGDFLIKQLDKMPLSYIEERYRMLDYQTIGGFMPSSCFEAIFAGPLKKMVQHIMETLEIIEMKIVSEIKNVMEYFFAMTNLSEEIAQIQSQQIRQLSKKFRSETQKVLRSQIDFISVSHEEFWSYKQIKSSLYGPQKQAFVQIKYIGKNYVKKVFDNIRETLPRLIWQNLLKEIVSFLETKGLEIFMGIVMTKGLKIEINERQLEWVQAQKLNEKRLDKLVYFFSLKTSSETGVKHLHQNMEKSWKRMFKNSSKQIEKQEQTQVEQKAGFLTWAKNLLRRGKKPQKKRSSSQQKQNKFESQTEERQIPLVEQHKKQSTLTEKNWLLIINTTKPVEEQKIKRSSEEGFPQRLRPAIWLYLAKKQISEPLKKVQTFLNQGANVSSEQNLQLKQIFKQIDKDINRTPPPNLFRKGYLKDTLTRILQAYSIYDKQLRYTQGMNFIVGIILCVLTHYGENCEFIEERVKSKTYFDILENQCLLIFIYIMEKKGLRKIMFIEKATITDLCIRLDEYIKSKSLVMYQKIQRSGFSVEMIFSGAIISGLTTSQIQFKLQKRVMDLLLAHEFSVLYKIIGQFVSTSESLCETMENQNLYYFLKGKMYNDVFKHIGDEGLAKMFHNL